MHSSATSDRDWLPWVVERYQGPLIRVAFRITGNLEVAREVAQDTFLRLCRQDRELINGKLTAWLFTVCRNRALDVLKKERRLQPVEDEDFWFMDGSSHDPAELAARQDSYDLVQSVMMGLSERDRDVVRFKFQFGMSYREIAEALEISESNVGFILHQTIRKIRKRVREVEGAKVEPKNRLLK